MTVDKHIHIEFNVFNISFFFCLRNITIALLGEYLNIVKFLHTQKKQIKI